MDIILRLNVCRFAYIDTVEKDGPHCARGGGGGARMRGATPATCFLSLCTQKRSKKPFLVLPHVAAFFRPQKKIQQKCAFCRITHFPTLLKASPGFAHSSQSHQEIKA
eukprot:352000-Chlamydomonas_euryale.AAC.5